MMVERFTLKSELRKVQVNHTQKGIW